MDLADLDPKNRDAVHKKTGVFFDQLRHKEHDGQSG